MRILHIENDPLTADSVDSLLRQEEMNVFCADCGEEGIDLAKRYDYDLIILALNLSDRSGFSVLAALRAARVNTPVIVLSSNAKVEAKVRALNTGADDYMTKPFHKDELVARVKAVVRRTKGYAQGVIAVGKLSISIHLRRAFVDQKPLPLTGKEYLMLELLALNKGRTLTKEMFLNHLYDHPDEPELKIIDVFICKLRKKIAETTGGAAYIETVWGRGYTLKDPEPGVVAAIAAA